MDVPQEHHEPGIAERSAKTAVILFLLLAIVTLAFGLGWGVKDLTGSSKTTVVSGGDPQTGQAGEDPFEAATLDEIYNILKNSYVDKNSLDAATLRQAAISGLLNALNDPHTAYLTPQDLKAGALDLSSTYQGIGATVSDRTGQVQIVAPFRDSPAEAAGIKAGDIILEVDGQKTDGWSSEEAVQKIRGVKGTPVTLMVKHSDGKIETLSVTRGDIQITSVYTDPNREIIPGESGTKVVDSTGQEAADIAYVNISQFHEKTAEELQDALKQINANPNYRGLILDLRDNPGGLLRATVDVADEFLDSGTILTEKDAGGKTTKWDAESGGLFTDLPIVILMSKGSASGAEVLAGALHDNGRATIVGTNSFGKGTVNQLQQLTQCGDPAGCGALYLSVGRWYTPNGDQIEGVGVKPDVELDMTGDDYIEHGDVQIFKAIDILRGK